MGKRPRSNRNEDWLVRSLDDLAAFDSFSQEILPWLRDALKGGLTKEEIQKHPKIQAALVARQVSMALTDKDSGKALAAIKDLRDRDEGRAVERKKIEHSMEQAPDEALDARLKSLLGEEDEEDSVH